MTISWFLLDFGDGIDAGKAGMPPLVGVKGRDAHQAMDAAFGFAETDRHFRP